MKKLIVLAVASLFATSAFAGEMKWWGNAGWRYNYTKHDDNLNSKDPAGKDVSEQITKTHAARANLGVTGGWENVEWGAAIRTGGAGSINTDYVNLQNGGDQGIGLSQAWFRYVRDFGSLDMALTIGRQANTFAYDTWSQQFFDNDVNFDGFGWQFKFGMFGFNAGQYLLGAKDRGGNGATTYTKTESTDAVAATNSKFNYLFGFQPHMTWKFTDSIETFFAVGYYLWSTDAYSNATNGGYNSAGLNAGTIPAVAPSTFTIHNPRQWQFLNTWSLPYKLSVNAELVINKGVDYNANTVAGYAGAVDADVSDSAFALGVKYGAVKKAHDWDIGYIYGSKGVNSVIGAFSNDLVPVDNKGHTIFADYAVADNFNVGFKWFSMKEKEKIDPTTGVAFAGNNANQELRTKYWEITTGVMF